MSLARALRIRQEVEEMLDGIEADYRAPADYRLGRSRLLVMGGLCAECGAEPKRPTSSLGDRCTERRSLQTRLRRARIRRACADCGGARERNTHTRCVACQRNHLRALNAGYQRNRCAARRAERPCCACGAPREPRQRERCRACQDKRNRNMNRDLVRARRARKKEITHG